MSAYLNRCRATLDARFHTLLGRWLRELPPEGWEGTPRELAAALYEEATHGEYVGRHVASKVASSYALDEAGFALTASRTASRRVVTIRRVKTNSRHEPTRSQGTAAAGSGGRTRGGN